MARVMKSFAHPSFFRLFDLLLSLTNPGLKRSHWTHDGVDFERERHSVMGPKHGLAIEIFTLRHAGRRGWSLMVTKEYWWAGEESKALKNLPLGTVGQRPARRHPVMAAGAGGEDRPRTIRRRDSAISKQ